MYIFIKKIQKKIQDFQKKKGKIFEKSFFELGALNFLVTYSKRPIFFFQRFQDSLKSSFQNGT